MHGEEGKGCTGKLDVHPCSLVEKKTPCPTLCPSKAIHPPSPREPVGCDAPAMQVEWRRVSGREAAEALAGGQVSSLAGDKPGVFRAPGGRKGAGSPRCQDWDATGILSSQLSSSLPSHRGAQSCQTGTVGDKDRVISPAALSFWLASRPVLAGLPGSQILRSPCNSPNREGEKQSSSWSSSPGRTQPQSVLDPSNSVWGPSGLSRKGKNYSRDPNVWGCWGWGTGSCHP